MEVTERPTTTTVLSSRRTPPRRSPPCQSPPRPPPASSPHVLSTFCSRPPPPPLPHTTLGKNQLAALSHSTALGGYCGGLLLPTPPQICSWKRETIG